MLCLFWFHIHDFWAVLLESVKIQPSPQGGNGFNDFNLKAKNIFDDFGLKAKARIWSRLSYMYHISLTAIG